MTDAPDDEGIHNLHPVNRLILNLAESDRQASESDIERIRSHVASVGFAAEATTRAGPRIAGLTWLGKTLHSRDRIGTASAHYLRHVVARQEWPHDTTLDGYIVSLRSAVLDPDGGIVLQLIQNYWHLTFVARSDQARGPAGGIWLAVGYGVNYGYWVTGYQPEAGLRRFTLAPDKGERWLCMPMTHSEPTSS